MDKLVSNLSRNRFDKLRTVERWIEQCVCEWVSEGHSFRELSTQERLQRIGQRIESFDPHERSKKPYYGLPPINPSGEKEIMPKSSVWTSRVKFDCLVAAQQFCQNPNV